MSIESAYLARLAPGSRRAQNQAIEVLRYHLAIEHPGDWLFLQREQVIQVRATLAEQYAPATARRMMSALFGVLTEALYAGQLPLDRHATLTQGIPPIRGSRPPAGRCLSDDELGRLLAAADTTRDRALLVLLAVGGLRRAEAAALTVPAVHPKDTALFEIRVRGKGGKVRSVFISGPATAFLANHWTALMGDAPSPPPFQPFLGLTASGIAKVVDRLSKKAGVPCTCHDLRRTCASKALDRGIDLATVQALLGHADPRTTVRYDRRGERALVAAANKIGQLAELS